MLAKTRGYRDFNNLPVYRKKPDSHGNMWEVKAQVDEIILYKTERYADLNAAAIALTSVRDVFPRLLRDFYAWKREHKRRVELPDSPERISEAFDAVDLNRTELMDCARRHAQACDILNNAVRIEHHIPIESLAVMADYDLPITAHVVPVNAQKVAPLNMPDLDAENYETRETELLNAG